MITPGTYKVQEEALKLESLLNDNGTKNDNADFRTIRSHEFGCYVAITQSS